MIAFFSLLSGLARANPRLVERALIGIAVIALFAYWTHHERTVGENRCKAEVAKEVMQATLETRHIDRLNEDHRRQESEAIEEERRAHQDQIDAARAVIQPVRLCTNPSRSPMPEAAGATSGTATSGEAQLPVRAEPDPEPTRDLSADFLRLVDECQLDNQNAVSWERWYQGIRR